jgi:hypothetical protein
MVETYRHASPTLVQMGTAMPQVQPLHLTSHGPIRNQKPNSPETMPCGAKNGVW